MTDMTFVMSEGLDFDDDFVSDWGKTCTNSKINDALNNKTLIMMAVNVNVLPLLFRFIRRLLIIILHSISLIHDSFDR